MVACWRPVGSGGIYGGLEARLGAAAGGSIRACWVFLELGVVTPAWASACARMWGGQARSTIGFPSPLDSAYKAPIDPYCYFLGPLTSLVSLYTLGVQCLPH